MPAPLLAKDEFQTIVAIIVMAFWALSWVIKLVSGQSKNVPPVASRPRAPIRPRDEKLQDEIDIFIQDVGGAKEPKRPAPVKPAGARPPVASRPQSPRPAAPVKAQGAPRAPENSPRRIRPETPRPAVTQPLAPPKARRERPGEEISTRHMTSSPALGTGVQQHVRQHMAERITREAEVFVKPSVEQSVTQHLGLAAVPGAPAQPGSAAPVVRDSLAAMLRQPGALRQAMIASVILGPPLGRTPRKR